MFPSDKELADAIDKREHNKLASLYACYCATFALAATGGQVVRSTSTSDELAVAAAYGAVMGAAARHRCEFSSASLESREVVTAMVAKLLGVQAPVKA